MQNLPKNSKKTTIYTEYNEKNPTLCGFVIPSFQRPLCWTETQKIRLVESIFYGFDIAPLVVAVAPFDATDAQRALHGSLIDGQHRLTALNDFFNGKFAVFNGLTFDALLNRDDIVKSNFLTYTIRLTKITATSLSTLKDFYDRLNYGGTAHTR